MTTIARVPVTILVVEDDAAQRRFLEQALTAAGYIVVTAASADEAIVAAEQHLPELIISDYRMPGRDGIALCREVRGRPELADAMFVLLSAVTDIELRRAGLDAGADDYLAKPIDVEELRSKVRALVRIKLLHDELRRDRAEVTRLNEVLTQGLAGVLTLLTHLIARRVPGALERADRASALVRWIGEHAALGDVGVHAIDVAARIHEIGKLDLPDALLAVPAARLAPAVREQLAAFAPVGGALVQRIPQLAPVAPWIRHQLENYDGTGLPDHLVGADIPVGGRILRVVHVLEDARAEGRTVEELPDILEAAQGTILGPRITRLAIEYVHTALDPTWSTGKRHVALDALEPGMRIAVDVYSARGTKLLARDATLTRTTIDRIRAFHGTDPIVDDLYVYDAPTR